MAGDVSNDIKTWTPDQIAFQAWLALPASARNPRTQGALAKQLEVHEGTLSHWKQLPGWNDAVYDLAMDAVKGELTPILHAHAKLAHKSLDSAKWLFELAGKWMPTTRQQHGNVPGENMTVEVVARDYRAALNPFLPPANEEQP